MIVFYQSLLKNSFFFSIFQFTKKKISWKTRIFSKKFEKNFESTFIDGTNAIATKSPRRLQQLSLAAIR